MKFIPSPHYNNRPEAIDTIVIHYTSGGTLKGSVAWFGNPKSKVSAHYIIGIDGKVIQMVKDENRAWHAGESSLYGAHNVNDFSIGIELVNWGIIKQAISPNGTIRYYCWPGKYTREYDKFTYGEPVEMNGALWAPYPGAQLASCARLCEMLRIKYPAITNDRVVGHMDIAPGRKQDPGPHFPMEWLRQESSPVLNYSYYLDVDEEELLARQSDRAEDKEAE